MKRSTVFQRTESGRDEIRRKTHGLTQSERLVLILVDGVADSESVRSRLRGLSDDRFNRALTKLVRNHLVQEVLMPVPGQEAETVDSNVADLFLRQDPLDPVTVISVDPEDEFGSAFSPSSAKGSGAASVSPAGTVDLHLWKSNNDVEADPFPVIRTESRIVPPADHRPLRKPRERREHNPAEPPVREFRPVATISHESAAHMSIQQNSEGAVKLPSQIVQKSSPVWLFWIVLTLLSLLTACIILFY